MVQELFALMKSQPLVCGKILKVRLYEAFNTCMFNTVLDDCICYFSESCCS